MALQISLPDQNLGGPADAAYVRINGFSKVETSFVVYIAIFISKEARHSSVEPIYSGSYNCKLGVDIPDVGEDYTDIFTKLYTWLKTLPDFNNAIDVIDPAPVVVEEVMPPPDVIDVTDSSVVNVQVNPPAEETPQ